MIIIDTALNKRQKENRPIQVGLIGAGFMGRGIALQILRSVPGMRLAGVVNRTLSEAERAYRQAGIEGSISSVNNAGQLEDCIANNRFAVSTDASTLCKAENIDVIIESTGHVEYSAGVVLEAIRYKKHVVLMNAELDATVGPLLKHYADKEGVVYTNADGDQPGVIMNLFRYVQSIGCRPVLAGNMKGLQDVRRTPETQKGYAEQYHQKPQMVTSFADGTKISMEMAVIANATGFTVGKRGMYGPECSHVNDAANLFPMEQMMETGLVDYVLGAEPGGGVFVLGYNENKIQQQYLEYYKMGNGPLYTFYTPYHLCHLEAPLTAARAVLFDDPSVAPLAGPVCDVITVAKKNLKAGDILDGIGGFTCYGELEKSEICQQENLLPMGLNEGCRLKHDITKDSIIGYNDVVIPEGRLVDTLRREQDGLFF
ncbi:putative homoserine dehydrogenase, contains C-terminal SAF domain [Candidatus Electrothrix marina]|uniref:Putative homoserine dehydrogenase, contains C-terminal SAF domain n=1 Tax=Candidatus Electrothrix marina TaxID=1859130 RepID=A0A444JCJ1_9BACT|nr:putative homoserine dehydrogenase, contains C-terminal SAF domain [Candidatus Electrothrix marina]